jgi:hypothetical protein
MALVVPIVADTSGLVRGLNSGQSSLRKFGKIAAYVAGAAAIGGLVKTLQIGTDEFMQQQKVAAQTSAVLKSTGGVANVTSKQITKLSESLMKKSGVDDEAIQSGQNLLLTFTKIRNETGAGNDIFDRATKAMLDLSVAMGKDLNSSAILVGKALNDPVKGASALSRAGVQLTAGQKEQIKTFVESGRVLDAQKIILKELTTQFGGSAEAAGKTLPGQLNILKQTFNNLAGELAATFLPSIATAATKLVEFLQRFAGAPTLRAKAEIIIRGIVDATGRAFSDLSDLYSWWTTTQRIELPARVIITPSGQQQFDKFFSDLEARAYRRGQDIGKSLADSLIGLFSSEGRKRAASTAKEFSDAFGGALLFLFRITGTTLAGALIAGLTSGINLEFASRIAEAIRSALRDAVDFLTKDFGGVGSSIIDKITKGFGTRSAPLLANRITQTVKDAIQSARSGLAGAASGLGGTLATILGATFTRPGGMTPAAILTEERKLEDERLALEEKRLKESADATDATEEDKLALREFYLNKEKTLRDRALQDEIASRQRGIDDLTEKFNQGLISAEAFASSLKGIIGSDLGTELGTAFAGAFSRELQSVVATARDIVSVTGQANPITGGGDTSASATLRSENERRYSEALAAWQKRYDARKKTAEDARSAGGISAAERREINAILAEWQRQPANAKPQRSAYGLAMGGILRQPTFVAGEAGKEAIIPLESGAAGKILRDALGGGGGSAQVINLTVNAGLGTNPDELAQVIVSSIKRFEKRNGSVFQSPLLSTATNTAGVTDTATSATSFNRFKTLRSS